MTTIEQRIMASVGLIYIVRKLVSPFALQWYALLASMGGIVMFVSLPNVAQNFQIVASGGVASIMTYIFSAILSTTLVVQLWLVVGAAACVSLFFRAARSFSSSRTFAA